jgi:hypothetical protein
MHDLIIEAGRTALPHSPFEPINRSFYSSYDQANFFKTQQKALASTQERLKLLENSFLVRLARKLGLINARAS